MFLQKSPISGLPHTLDKSSFSDKVNGICTSGMISLTLSLAKNVGILQTLIDSESQLTSQQIADSNQLKERYVREILDCLATAELIQVSKNSDSTLVYYLKADDKQALKGPLFPMMSYPSIFASVYDQIKAVIQTDGLYGIRYTDEMHDVMEDFSFHNTDGYVKNILESVPQLKEKLEAGIDVIEFGCGSGRLLSRFASMFPNSRFVASEVLQTLLDKTKALLSHISNIQYEIHDLCLLPETQNMKYDWIHLTNVVHALPQPLKALRGIHNFLKKPEGVFTFIDTATSGNPLADIGDLKASSLYAASTFLCIPESFQSKDSVAMGSCWGKQTAIDMAKSAGFSVQSVMIGPHSALYICKP